MNSQRANSITSILLRLGMAVKSKVSNDFTDGNRADWMQPQLFEVMLQQDLRGGAHAALRKSLVSTA